MLPRNRENRRCGVNPRNNRKSLILADHAITCNANNGRLNIRFQLKFSELDAEWGSCHLGS